jgi:hypothetical protein
LAVFEPATFGSSGKHTNHYTTKATREGNTKVDLGCQNINWLKCLRLDELSAVMNSRVPQELGISKAKCEVLVATNITE